MDAVSVKLAGLTVVLQARSPQVRKFCRDYLTEPVADPDLIASCTEEEIRREQAAATEYPVSADHAEILCLYRSLAEQFPARERLLMHGAVIEYDGGGYAFTAPSGTGKTTHIRLWRQYLGHQIGIINGDKPLMRITETETTVYGTPWSGKERWNRNCQAPLRALCLLERGTVDTIERVSPDEALEPLLHQFYLPHTGNGIDRTLELVDRLIRTVPLYRLHCTMNESAVKTAFEAMTGKPYAATPLARE